MSCFRDVIGLRVRLDHIGLTLPEFAGRLCTRIVHWISVSLKQTLAAPANLFRTPLSVESIPDLQLREDCQLNFEDVE